MEKYVVCCKSFDDIQEFYNDMETPGGNDYVPDRVVECTNRKALSRNTIYLLSEEEVEKIRQDPRVKLVVSYKELYIDRKVEPLGWSQYSDQWAKDSTTNFDANDKNWALLQNTYDGNNFLSSLAVMLYVTPFLTSVVLSPKSVNAIIPSLFVCFMR